MVKEQIMKAKTPDERYELTKPFFDKRLMGVEIQKITGLSEATICNYKKRYCYENGLSIKSYGTYAIRMTEMERMIFSKQWVETCNLVRKGLGLGSVNYG